VFKAHDIGYFFYNGGNDSMDTAWKVSQIAEKMGYPVVCVGVPKTVDNDLPHTDCCPGFGSVAKYVATSIREAGYDVASMARTSTKIFVLEVMGRHAGWITPPAAWLPKMPASRRTSCSSRKCRSTRSVSWPASTSASSSTATARLPYRKVCRTPKAS
jgi:hypothetical protein